MSNFFTDRIGSALTICINSLLTRSYRLIEKCFVFRRLDRFVDDQGCQFTFEERTGRWIVIYDGRGDEGKTGAVVAATPADRVNDVRLFLFNCWC